MHATPLREIVTLSDRRVVSVFLPQTRDMLTRELVKNLEEADGSNEDRDRLPATLDSSDADDVVHFV